MTEVLYMTWEHFDEAMGNAVAEISKHRQLPTGVYGIPRGGLIISVTLSHRLAIPWLAEPQPGCILVDDVVETGHTMLRLIDNLQKTYPGLHWSTWVWVAKSILPGIEYHRYVDPTTWVCFPWSDPLKIEEEMKAYHTRLALETTGRE